MKAIGLFGLLMLQLMFVYGRFAGGSSEAAQGPDRPLTQSAAAVTDAGGNLPVALSEYVFLHQTRHEIIPVPAIAGVAACPE